MARKKQNSSISLPHGRKRTISPGFFTDATLLSLPPLHRIFFAGLFAFADRAGRLLYRPIDLKIRILPMDPFDPVQGLADLESRGLIRIYESGPLKVIAMKDRSWREVQRLHPDEPDSALPAPPGDVEAISVIGNDPSDPISVIGNTAVDPIPGPGSSGSAGSSCLRDPRDPRDLPPTPPQNEGGMEQQQPTRRRRRRDQPPAPPPPPCAACGAGTSAELAGVKLCYACLPLATAWAEQQRPGEPWKADVASWARRRREPPIAGVDDDQPAPRLQLLAGGVA